jgi:hypothetical protein
MYIDIRMSRTKFKINIDGPILAGSISTAKSTCGKPNCACKGKRPKLHGPFYRWTGVINGKRTTKTISKEEAEECLRRIRNYKKMQEKIDEILKIALENAPWERH